jgi:hypothetical protein
MRDPEKYRQEHPDQREDPMLDGLERWTRILSTWGQVDNSAEANRLRGVEGKFNANQGQQRINLDARGQNMDWQKFRYDNY